MLLSAVKWRQDVSDKDFLDNMEQEGSINKLVLNNILIIWHINITTSLSSVLVYEEDDEAYQ